MKVTKSQDLNNVYINAWRATCGAIQSYKCECEKYFLWSPLDPPTPSESLDDPRQIMDHIHLIVFLLFTTINDQYYWTIFSSKRKPNMEGTTSPFAQK